MIHWDWGLFLLCLLWPIGGLMQSQVMAYLWVRYLRRKPKPYRVRM